MKRWISAALLIFCLGLALLSAGAAEPEGQYDTVMPVEGSRVEDLQAAMDALSADAGHVKLVLRNRLFSTVRDGVVLSVPADKGIDSLTLAYEGEGMAYISIYKTTSNIGNPDFFYFFANGVPLTIDKGVTFGTPHAVTGPGMTNMDYYQGDIALFGGGNGTDVASTSITVNEGGGVNAAIYGGGLNGKVNGGVSITAHGGYRAIYGGGLASPGADSADVCADVAGKVTIVADNNETPRRVSAPGENRINSWYNGSIHGGGSVVLGSVSFTEARTFTARVLGGVSMDVNCLVSSAELFGGGAVTFRGANDAVTLNADVEGPVDVRIGEKTQQAADFSAATSRYPFCVVGGGCINVSIYGSSVQAASAQVCGDVTITAVESLAAAEGKGGICSIIGGGVTEADSGSYDATVHGDVTIETSRKTLPFRAVGGVYNNMGVVGGGYSSGGTANVTGDVNIHIRKAPGQSADYQNLRNVIGGGATNGAGAANVDGNVTITVDDDIALDGRPVLDADNGQPISWMTWMGITGGGRARTTGGTANVGGAVKITVGADAEFSGAYRIAGGGWAEGNTGTANVAGPVTIQIGEGARLEGEYRISGGGWVSADSGSATVGGPVSVDIGANAAFDGEYMLMGGSGVTGCWYGRAAVTGPVTTTVGPGAVFDGNYQLLGGGWGGDYDNDVTVHGDVTTTVGDGAAFNGTYRVVGGGWAGGGSYGGVAHVDGNVETRIGENASFAGGYLPGLDGNADAKLGLVGGGWVTGSYGAAHVTGTVTTAIGENAAFRGACRIVSGGAEDSGLSNTAKTGAISLTLNGTAEGGGLEELFVGSLEGRSPSASATVTLKDSRVGWMYDKDCTNSVEGNQTVTLRFLGKSHAGQTYFWGWDYPKTYRVEVGDGSVPTEATLEYMENFYGYDAAFGRMDLHVYPKAALKKTGDGAMFTHPYDLTLDQGGTLGIAGDETLAGSLAGGGTLELLKKDVRLRMLTGGATFTGTVNVKAAEPAAGQVVATTVQAGSQGLFVYSGDDFYIRKAPDAAGNYDWSLAALTPPTAATGLAYTGRPQPLLSAAGSGQDDTMGYSLDGETYFDDLAHVTATDAGTYTVYYRMFSPDAGEALDKPRSVAVTIAKADPTAADLVFTPPADLTYTGQAQTAAVTLKSGRAGAGEITVHYSADPVNAGEYTVSVDVAEGSNYNAVTDLTDPSWTFTIAKAPNAITDLACPGISYGQTPSPNANAAFGEIIYQYSRDPDGPFGDWNTANAYGAWYVKATVAGTDNYDGAEAVRDFQVAALSQDAPNIAIDFAAETLTGFVPGGRYTVGGAEVTPDESGALPIGPYLGQDLTIVKLGDGVSTADSPGQTLNVPARPGAPEGVAAGNETVLGKGDGRLTGLTSAMEYSPDGRAPWTDCPGGELPWPAGADVYVRMKATETAFAGAALPLRVDPGQPLTVTFQTGEDAAPAPVELAYNAALAPPEEPARPGYAFGGWFRDGEYTQPWDFDNDRVTENLTLYARWIKLHDHVWAPAWDGNDTHHWHPCTASGCDLAEPIQMDGYGPHSPDPGTVTTHATLDAPGERTFRCTDCQRVLRTEAIPQLSAAGSHVVVTPGAPGITVDKPRLDAVAEAERPTGGNVTVTLTVCLADDPRYQDAVAAIRALAGEQSVEYMDLTLTKETVDADGKTETAPITDTNGRVLEIAVDFDFTGKRDVTVYRCHGDGVGETLAQADTRADGTFRLESAENKVYIYASKFSVYAIGYTLIPDDTAVPGGTPRYSVVASAAEGGTISPEGRTRVRRGRDLTVTITPDEGFAIADVLVDRKSVGAVREYTFEKITTGHSIHAVFTKQTVCPRDAACPIHPFADAVPAAWYHDGVHFCLERGLMQGYGGGLFGPSDTLTRAQLAQILYNRAGKPAVSAKAPFDDVGPDAWYAPAVAWAAEAGIVEGYGDGRFGPEDAVTREQLAAMLWRRANRQGKRLTGTLSADFPDADAVSPWAREAMGAMTETGVIRGKEDKRLDPQGQATRAESATMLHRFCALTEN